MLFFEGNVENRLKPINSSKIAFFSPSANMAQDAIINAKLVFFFHTFSEQLVLPFEVLHFSDKLLFKPIASLYPA